MKEEFKNIDDFLKTVDQFSEEYKSEYVVKWEQLRRQLNIPIDTMTTEEFLETINHMEVEYGVTCVKTYQTELENLISKQRSVLNEAIVIDPGIDFADGKKVHIFGVKTLSETVEWYKNLILNHERRETISNN